MSRKALVVLILILAWMLPTAVSGAQPDFNEGQWEITTQVEISGMPMQMPPITHLQCLSRNEPVPATQQPGQECRIKDMKTSGDTVIWQIECQTREGRMTGSGKITYAGDQFQGTMQMTLDPGNMRMNYRMNGRWVGPCP